MKRTRRQEILEAAERSALFVAQPSCPHRAVYQHALAIHEGMRRRGVASEDIGVCRDDGVFCVVYGGVAAPAGSLLVDEPTLRAEWAAACAWWNAGPPEVGAIWAAFTCATDMVRFGAAISEIKRRLDAMAQA